MVLWLFGSLIFLSAYRFTVKPNVTPAICTAWLFNLMRVAAADSLAQVEEDEADPQVDVAGQLIRRLAAYLAAKAELRGSLIVELCG